MTFTLTTKLAAPLALMAILLPYSSVASSSYKSATFSFEGDAVASRVEMPAEARARMVAVYCQAAIDTTGSANEVVCYEKGGLKELASQTQSAIAGLRFQPAEVDGDAVPVRMHFRVVYSGEQEGNSQTWLLPNLGTMQHKYGASYIAPQERLDGENWYKAYSEYAGNGAIPFFADGSLARIAATVEEDGATTNVRTVERDRRHGKDAEVVESALRTSRFIPGFVGDKAVTMDYLAVLSYHK